MPLPERGEPTEAEPGSEWKVRVLAARQARGEPLFHPEDAGSRVKGRRLEALKAIQQLTMQ